MILVQVILTGLGILALILGILLICHPRASKRMNLPFCQAIPFLKNYYRLERYYYRYHHLTGTITLLGGVLLVFVAYVLAVNDLIHLKDPDISSIFQDALFVFLLISGPGLIIFGLVVIIRPSALKRFESLVNQAVTKETVYALIRAMRSKLATFSAGHPLVMGILSLAAGIFLIYSAGFLV